MKRAVLSACILAFALLLTACGPASSDSTASASDPASGEQAFHYGGDVTLRILSGSENQELEGILDDFARERGVNIEMEYQGSLDIMRTLQGETVDYDAVWPASRKKWRLEDSKNEQQEKSDHRYRPFPDV